MKKLDIEDYKFIVIILSMICLIFIGKYQSQPPKQFGAKIEKHY